MGPQVQQRALPDDFAYAHRLHQAMGEVSFSGLAVAGVGAANEHMRRVPRLGGEGNHKVYFMALQTSWAKKLQVFRPFSMPKQPETGKIPEVLANMG